MTMISIPTIWRRSNDYGGSNVTAPPCTVKQNCGCDESMVLDLLLFSLKQDRCGCGKGMRAVNEDY